MFFFGSGYQGICGSFYDLGDRLQRDRSPSLEGVTSPDFCSAGDLENTFLLFGLFCSTINWLSWITDYKYYKLMNFQIFNWLYRGFMKQEWVYSSRFTHQLRFYCKNNTHAVKSTINWLSWITDYKYYKLVNFQIFTWLYRGYLWSWNVTHITHQLRFYCKNTTHTVKSHWKNLFWATKFRSTRILSFINIHNTIM